MLYLSILYAWAHFLKSTPNDKFLGNFLMTKFFSLNFCQKSAERQLPKKFFFQISFCWRCLNCGLNRGPMSYSKYVVYNHYFGISKVLNCIKILYAVEYGIFLPLRAQFQQYVATVWTQLCHTQYLSTKAKSLWHTFLYIFFFSIF